jgi:pimeloyl-ACP methyl ester carboxylesterase
VLRRRSGRLPTLGVPPFVDWPAQDEHAAGDPMDTGRFERIVMPDVGHFLYLEQPDAVADHILRFLKS